MFSHFSEIQIHKRGCSQLLSFFYIVLPWTTTDWWSCDQGCMVEAHQCKWKPLPVLTDKTMCHMTESGGNDSAVYVEFTHTRTHTRSSIWFKLMLIAFCITGGGAGGWGGKGDTVESTWTLPALNTEMKWDGKLPFMLCYPGQCPHSLWESASNCTLSEQAGNTESLFFPSVPCVSHLIPPDSFLTVDATFICFIVNNVTFGLLQRLPSLCLKSNWFCFFLWKICLIFFLVCFGWNEKKKKG